MIKNFFWRTILCLYVFLSATSLFAQPLTGTKTIGGTAPDYTTFISAVVDLNLNGVGAGGVTFVMRDGNYGGSITIQNTGTQANPIVFESENLNASLVTITNSNITDVLILEGASYITFRALTIDYTGTSSNSAIEIRDNSDYVTIADCILDGVAVTSTAFASSVIYANESLAIDDCESLVVQNCTIRNGSYGIYFGMSTSQPSGVRVENTRFESAYGGGIYLESLTAPIVSGNTITTAQTGNSSFYGIYLNNCDGQSIITENYIYTSGSGEIAYGINLNGSASTAGNNALIANNSIQISNDASIAAGIEQSNNSTYFDIISNTIYVSGGSSSSTFAYRTYTFSDDTKIRDNIFVNVATGTGISSNQTVYIANATGVSLASHNNYWTANTGNPFRAHYTNSYTSLSSYTTVLGEVSAMNIDPQMTFVTNVGWKATNSALTGSGIYFATIPGDIDGTTRLNPTTIGAHENAASTPLNDNICNATVINLGTATAYSNGGATVEGNEPVPPTANCSTGWCATDVAAQNSVWFTFTLATTKKVNIITTGFDNQIALYTAASCNSTLTFVAANDSAGTAAQISGACLPAGIYYLQIDGFQGASGTGNITVEEVALSTPFVTAGTPLCDEFIARWTASPGATTYYIDIALNVSFTLFLPGYNNYDAGNTTSLLVSPLPPDNNYFYRVRATNGCVTTANSSTQSIQPLRLPEADFTYTVNGLTVNFTNTTDDGDTYLWNFGNGQPALAIENPIYVYSAAGIYQVQLIATNTCGSDTITQTVNVNCSSIQVSVTPGSNVAFCNGDSAVLATTPVTGYTYEWLKDGQAINGAQDFSLTVFKSGNYQLRVTNTTGCTGNSNVVNVTEHAVPIVAISHIGGLALCTGNYVELLVTSGGSTFQWYNGGQPINNANGASHLTYTAGNYWLSVTDANGCSGISDTLVVTLNQKPVITIQANGVTTFCAGKDVELTTTSTGFTYQWLNNAQTISNANGAAYSATTSGNYALSVTDANGCSDTSNVIQVTTTPALTVAIQASGATTFCQGDDVGLATTSTGLTYQWLNDAQTVNNATSAAYTATTAGNYALSVTDANGCTATSNAIVVTVNNLPAVTLAAFDTVCLTDMAFLLTGGAPAGGTYFVESVANDTFNPKNGAGVYEIEYTYTDGNNCSATASRDIVVEVCIGVEDILNGTISLSPNPASEFVTLQISGNVVREKVTAYVYDAAGREVLRQTLSNNSQTISVKEIPAGVYLVRIIIANKALYETKISVTH